MDSIYLIVLAYGAGAFALGLLAGSVLRIVKGGKPWKMPISVGLGVAAGFSVLWLHVPEDNFYMPHLLVFLLAGFLTGMGIYLGLLLSQERGVALPDSPVIPKIIQTLTLSDNCVLENRAENILITIQLKQKNGRIILSIIRLFLTLISLPLIGLLANFLLEGTSKMQGVATSAGVLGLCLLIIYSQYREMLVYFVDRETIGVGPTGIWIERSGFATKEKQIYQIAEIKKLGPVFLQERHSNQTHSRFLSQDLDTLKLDLRGVIPFRTFGRGLALADVQKILTIIFDRYPQYKG